MKVVVICSNSFAAQIALRDLWASHANDISGVVIVSQLKGSTQEQLGKYLKLLKTCGPGFLLLKTVEVIFFPAALKAFSPFRKHVPVESRLPLMDYLRKQNIPFIKTSDVNSAGTKATIKQWKPDLILSAYGTQIFDSELIRCATLTINVHGGPLPAYRGSAPDFWMLFNKDPELGITVHVAAEELDAGEVLESRKFATPAGCSVYKAHYLLSRAAGAALSGVVASIKNNSVVKSKQIGTPKRYRLPTRSESSQFKGKWITLRDLLTLW